MKKGLRLGAAKVCHNAAEIFDFIIPILEYAGKKLEKRSAKKQKAKYKKAMKKLLGDE